MATIGAHRVSTHVNTATTGRGGTTGAGTANCALCTAAGAVNLTYGFKVHTSGRAARMLGTSDGKLGIGSGLDEQATGIAAYVKSKTSRTPQQIGTQAAEVSYGTGTTWMQSFPDGTVFALSASGNVLHDQRPGARKCHWLNAYKNGGSLFFVDFQADRSIPTRPGMDTFAQSTVPVLGIVTQQQSDNPTMMTDANQPGAFLPGATQLVVIAFPPR
jgi:hypothetical protein